jgi:hypothetical protein
VSRTVEAALLSQGQNLYRAVSANPVAWANMSIRVRSAALVQETIIHLVGLWNSLDDREKSSLQPCLQPLVQRKVIELKEQCQKAERRLLTYFPAPLARETPVGGLPPNRSSYGNDVYIWMALTIFRQFLATAFSQDKHHSARDHGFALYQIINDGDYLRTEELAGFHRRFPMSPRGRSTIEDHIRKIQIQVKVFVQPIVGNVAQLDTERYKVGHLTCVSVRKEEVTPVILSKAGKKNEGVPKGFAGAEVGYVPEPESETAMEAEMEHFGEYGSGGKSDEMMDGA